MKYTLITNGDFHSIIVDNGVQQWSVPADPKNVMYAEYLAWVAEGNTAEEWQPVAVEPETTQPDTEEGN
jgi:hypothetical protein